MEKVEKVEIIVTGTVKLSRSDLAVLKRQPADAALETLRAFGGKTLKSAVQVKPKLLRKPKPKSESQPETESETSS